MSISIDELWVYSDPAGSEQRFRAALQTQPALEAEILTQIARALGLQRKFDDGHEVLDQASAIMEAGSRAEVRYMLERGRLLNSSGAKYSAITFFMQALDAARAIGEDYLAVDAAHMMGIVEEGEESLNWNKRAIAMAEASGDEQTQKWLASLLNNTGWSLFDMGRFDESLELFMKAQVLRSERQQVREEQIARWCIARCLRALGRLDEALAMQMVLAGEAAEDGFVSEELALLLHELGRLTEVAEHATRAIKLLGSDTWFVENESARLEKLRELAATHQSA